MKASRKLIPAFAMLLIAAVMMSTASYALFVTNGTVQANGMSITAKANTTYLMISSTEGGFESDITQATVETVSTNGTKYPIVYDGTQWKKAVGKDFTDGTATGGYTEVTDTDAYVVSQSFWVKVAPGYDSASNFKLKSIVVTGSSQAVSVMVEAGSAVNYTTFTYNKDAKTTTHSVVGGNLYDTVTSSTALEFVVHIYINGDHPDVTNQNFLDDVLKNLKVDLTFEAISGPADAT